MVDPLILLRQFHVKKKEIVEKDNYIEFGEFSWPKTVNTNYLNSISGRDGRSKEYYTLECLVYFLKNVHLTHPVYVKQATANNIPTVRRPDRKDLLAYLNGETARSSSIDKSVPLEIPTPVKRSIEDCQTKTPKKIKLEETQVQRANEQLAASLDALEESSIKTEPGISLPYTVSVENVVPVKAERLENKRKTFKKEDDIDI
ncbi:hypothetical protein CHUAL_008159 [Chamberlinius hualienensis]